MLHQLVIDAARRAPEATAVRGPDGALSYRELDAASNQLARALAAAGVRKGDRVGLWASKSIRGVVALQAILRCGAAYVPLDPLNPVARARTIIDDAAMRAVVTTTSRARELRAAESTPFALLSLDDEGMEAVPGWRETSLLSSAALPDPEMTDAELAYILYTSGSTGTPKGVCISERNALAFIEWAAAELSATGADRFANHAPFFFDLSVLDLYVTFLSGGCVCLVPEPLAFSPEELVRFLISERISIWYSVPSALILMMEKGGLLDVQVPELRALLFAGEPFPVKQLRRLRDHLPAPRFLNLYGPTETNVCTFYELHALDPGRAHPIPIGKECCGDRAYVDQPIKGDDGLVTGELVVEGPTVMLGYWGKPPQQGPYATGDLVRLLPDGNYEYLGRRDHMVKVRGRRIEPGEIEVALLRLPSLREVAVVVEGEGADARLVAYAVLSGTSRPSLIEVKRHCAERLPNYMIVDDVRFLPDFPRTRNGKVDRKVLAAAAAS